jgi:hypothetical protein
MDISCHSPSLRIHRARRIVSIELRHARWPITIDFAGKRVSDVAELGTTAFVNGGNSGTSSECSIPSGIHICLVRHISYLLDVVVYHLVDRLRSSIPCPGSTMRQHRGKL